MGLAVNQRLWGCVLCMSVGLLACGDTSEGGPEGSSTGSSAGETNASGGSSGPGEATSEGGVSSAGGSSTGTEGGETGESPPVDWELDDGHFYPAVMPPVAIYPRGDDEVESWARHRWAHPDIEYRIPAAVVQGGAWPFLYELVDGPEGARVGATLQWEDDRMVADDDYGVLRWTPSAADEGQTFDFHVRVTDQEGTTVDVQWTTTVDSTRFVFVSPEGSDDALGTIDDPLETASGWYLDDPADDSYLGRLVYFRGGQYAPTGSPANNDNFRMESDRKPMTIMGVPGEEVVFDSTLASWTFWEGSNDVFIAGIHFAGSKIEQPDGSPIRNARNIAFYGTANHDRVTFFENTASDIQPGNPVDDMVGNDNPAFVWRPNSAPNMGHHWSFVRNDFDTAGPRTSNGPSCVSLSNVSYVVYELNTVSLWSGTGTFFDKSNNDHLTQRNNDLWHVSGPDTSLGHALGAGMSDSYDPAHDPGFIETCWNRIRTPDMGVQSAAIEFGGSIPDPGGEVWAYRNSVQGNVQVTAVDNYSVVADKNVLQGGYLRDAQQVFDAGDNIVESDFAAVVFDDNTGWRADADGTHGADVR